ncbi:hypothetical protein RLEG12_00850 (plasmid) [Rhizobium leguminosarum bv. trifolii CB782]|nr:hypothetical protein RLEG12_00850 [Rhizobium leguminosarum bv. trifolii CB782]
MPRSFCFPPVEYSRGTRPSHAARSQIASFLELSAVSNGSQERSCPQRSNPRDRHEPSCDILATGDRLDLAQWQVELEQTSALA